MKLKWNRQLWNRLVVSAPEGFNVSYQNGRIVIAKEDPYFAPWYKLNDILIEFGY